jgi:hypothetical protein
MTRNDDIEQVLELWLAEGPRHMSDRLFDGTLDRIDRLPHGRLADLSLKVSAMHLHARLLAAAAVIVVLLGVGLAILNGIPGVGGKPTPAPTTTSAGVAAMLQSWWSAVGDRPSPGDWGVADNTFEITPTGLAIEQVHGNVLSSWSVMDGGSRLVVRWEREVPGSVPSYERWRCQVGDEGVYTVLLSGDDATLTLGLVSDPCAPRALFLPGAWTRCATLSDCLPDVSAGPSADANAAASAAAESPAAVDPEATDHRVAVPGFLPFGPGTTGTFSATVSTQPASQISPNGLQLVNPFGPREPIGDSSIYIGSGILPGFQPSGACASPFAGPRRTPAALIAWIQTFASLEVSSPQPVTIGSLSGLVVDITEHPDASSTCGLTTPDGQRIEILAAGTWLTGSTRLRLFLLDRGDGESIMIDVASRGQPTWASVDAAMPIVHAFEFVR